MSTNTHEWVRYADSVDAVPTDGRDIDTALAVLTGEGAQQKVTAEDPGRRDVAAASAEEEGAGYYGRPMLKESVWSIDIPIYYFLGGAAGAALTLGAALQLAPRGSRRDLRRLSETCHWIGIIGSTAGAGFLIHDLGRPARFLYMMRVFRPTSPMNMGAWILSGAAPTAITTGLLINRKGIPGAIGEVSGWLSGLFGAALAGYTGVLVSNTAIPLWRESRRWMPVLFAASGASAAASVIEIASGNRSSRAVTRTFGTVARLAEMGAALQIDRAVSSVPQVAKPLRKGGPSVLWKAATALTAASLCLSLTAGKSRKRTAAAGWLGVAGSLCLRFAVHYLGNASARDPQASFVQQRAQRFQS